MVELNWFLSNLNFTHETSKENVAFLDYNANLNNGMICRELNTKCTDYHQYLHYNSSHPERIKKSIFYNQTLRWSNICF